MTIEDEIKQAMNRMITTRPKILDHIIANNQKGKSWQSSIPCPVCQTGTVHFTYAGSYNGHIHARCTTSSCVNWME